MLGRLPRLGALARGISGRWDHHWRGPGGGKEVLSFSYPLILAQMTFTLQTFVDRLLLTWYSPEAVAAATASLFVTLVGLLVCIGTAEYATTFIAQYLGTGRPDRVGPILWQAIWFALFSGLFFAALSPGAGRIFEAAGHDPALLADETAYARILLLGAFPIVLMPALSSFFAGRGQTGVVLLGNAVSALVNGVLDYLWIFGRLGFPEGGVQGAAWATVASSATGAVLLFGLVLRPRVRAEFDTLRSFRFDPRLFGRLLRFGVPAGSHFALELFAFALFTLLIGRLGSDALAATGIAFNLNGLVFLPMVGLGMGVMALVGRYQGTNRSDLAARVTWTAFSWSLVYLTLWALAYLLLPRLLLYPYAVGADPEAFAPIADTTVLLLRFVAVYSIFDMMNTIFAAGLRGAGDTAFPTGAAVAASWTVMLVPAYVACVHLGQGLLVAWTLASLYVVTVGLLMMSRFRAGGWHALRVVEPGLPVARSPLPGGD